MDYHGKHRWHDVLDASKANEERARIRAARLALLREVRLRRTQITEIQQLLDGDPWRAR